MIIHAECEFVLEKVVVAFFSHLPSMEVAEA